MKIGVVGTFLAIFLLFAASEMISASETKADPSTVQSQVTSGNPFITEMRRVTFVGPRAGEGYFSQDGQLMIFQSEREKENPFYQIYVVDRDSLGSMKDAKLRGPTFSRRPRTPVRLSPGVGKTSCAWIHPSKTKALFSSTHLDPQVKEKTAKEFDERKNPVKGKYSWSFDETFDIFEAPITDALKNGRPVDVSKLKRLTTEKGYDAEASYSPDGTKIVFASNRAGYTESLNDEEKKIFAQDPSYMMDLYLMNADGSDVERLTTARGYDGGPFFSSDGRKITWRRFSPNGQTAEIMVMDLKTRKEKAVTHMGSMSWAPFFHPSGDYIIFTSNKLGYVNFELFIVDSDGQHEPVRVSYLDGFDGLPVFLPNGHELSWTRKDEKGESQIYLAKWDDGAARSALDLGRIAPKLTELSPEIREEDLRAWVSYLASAPQKGRRPGSSEEREYAETIGRMMKSMGLKPAFNQGHSHGKTASYVQAFEFTSGIKLGPLNRLRLREKGSGQDLAVEKDWVPLSISKSGDVPESKIAFAGYGLTTPASEKIGAFDSYEGLDVQGKWVAVLADLPREISPERRFYFHLFSRAAHKALIAKQKGAVGLILLDSAPKLSFQGASEAGIPVMAVSPNMTARFFTGAKTGWDDFKKTALERLDRGEVWNESLETSLGATIDLQHVKSTALNVAGIRAGSNPRLPPLVIGAHGDHLGLGESAASSLAHDDERGQVHFGADDNASGVAALLELAHAPALRNGKWDRDVIFAMWSGEELGVLGSSYFVKNRAEEKLVKPLAYLNMDMVGRLRDTLFVQGVASAPEWRADLEGWAPQISLQVSAMADPYLPTDAMSFYLGEVPILSFFTGSHAEYHSPRDRYETLNFSGLAQVTKVVRRVAEDLGRATTKLTWVKVESGAAAGGEGRSFRLYLGTVPDYRAEGLKGVKISGTAKDSPAETAGLKAGDVIVSLGGIKIDNIYDYVFCLQALKADQEIPIRLERAGQTVELKITPRLKR